MLPLRRTGWKGTGAPDCAWRGCRRWGEGERRDGSRRGQASRAKRGSPSSSATRPRRAGGRRYFKPHRTTAIRSAADEDRRAGYGCARLRMAGLFMLWAAGRTEQRQKAGNQVCRGVGGRARHGFARFGERGHAAGRFGIWAKNTAEACSAAVAQGRVIQDRPGSGACAGCRRLPISMAS